MIYVSRHSSTMIFMSSFYGSICSFTCCMLIFKLDFSISTCFSTCSILIFKYDFCKATCGVGASPSTCSTLIFRYGFYKLSFKPIFSKKSFRFDLSSSILIGKSM
jgi:hypothetical protein